MHSKDKPMSTREWFLFSLVLGAMFAPAFLFYGGATWVALSLTVLVAAIPAVIGLAKFAKERM